MLDVPQDEPEALLGSYREWALFEHKLSCLVADVSANKVLGVESLLEGHDYEPFLVVLNALFHKTNKRHFATSSLPDNGEVSESMGLDFLDGFIGQLDK